MSRLAILGALTLGLVSGSPYLFAAAGLGVVALLGRQLGAQRGAVRPRAGALALRALALSPAALAVGWLMVSHDWMSGAGSPGRIGSLFAWWSLVLGLLVVGMVLATRELPAPATATAPPRRQLKRMAVLCAAGAALTMGVTACVARKPDAGRGARPALFVSGNTPDGVRIGSSAVRLTVPNNEPSLLGVEVLRSAGWEPVPGMWTEDGLSVVPIRNRALWLVCPIGRQDALDRCRLVDGEGLVGPVQRSLLAGFGAVPGGWLMVPFVGVVVAAGLGASALGERFRWRRAREALHLGGGLVRLGAGEPRLVPSATGLPAGSVVVRLEERPESTGGPYRGSEAWPGRVWPGTLADRMDASAARATGRLAAAVLALAFLGAPVAAAALLLR